LARSVDETARSLGADEAAYRHLMQPLADRWQPIISDLLGPLRVPSHPAAALRFGYCAVRSARGLARSRFTGRHAQALFAGNAAHALLPLTAPATAAFGLTLQMLGHAVGWPAVVGGTQTLADAMAGLLRSLGGEIETGRDVRSLRQFRAARAVLLDLTPRQVTSVAGDELPARYTHALGRYRYGPGVFKLDYALDAPVPWTAEACRSAGVVHVGGTLAEITHAEAEVAAGRHPARPFVLVAQQSLFDATRAPAGGHTLWAYCHVPNGSTVDMTDTVERQLERFAPGFRDVVRGRSTRNPTQMQAHNPNYVGGDINGGAADLRQVWMRPTARIVPYTTPNRRLFVCSSSTPPGGGVHGMCGWHAARAALRTALR